jgi:hypothetical protein
MGRGSFDLVAANQIALFAYFSNHAWPSRCE